MEKIGIEPIMFTTREQIYSLPQHRQSLPLLRVRFPILESIIRPLITTCPCSTVKQPISAFFISAGNTATPAYPVANRTLDSVWIAPHMFFYSRTDTIRAMLTYLHTHQLTCRWFKINKDNQQLIYLFCLHVKTPTVRIEPAQQFCWIA